MVICQMKKKKKRADIWWARFFFVTLHAERTQFIKGCSRVWAEMIPSEPDTDNADAGMMSNTEQPLILCINK